MKEEAKEVITMLMREYKLIQSKDSKLSAMQRHDVVRRVEALIRSGVITITQ